jgi:hypothetical protein
MWPSFLQAYLIGFYKSVTFISDHTHGFPWIISDTSNAKHTWCLCVVSSVLSVICDRVDLFIAIGGQVRGLFLEVFVKMVSVVWFCICSNRLFSCVYCNDYVSYVFIM